MPFAYEAVDSSGSEVSAVIEAENADEALAQLHARGLFVTNVSQVDDGNGAERPARLKVLLSGRAGNTKDRMLFTQQMAMMLHAGSQMVPALTAIGSQIEKPGWQKIVHDICQNVENGLSLSNAMADYPEAFDQTFRAVVAAGENTASTAEAFDRLALMTKTQHEIKVRVIGALVYPIVLVFMAIGVVSILMFYVLPKFDELYATLGTDLPWITTAMIGTSRWLTEHAILAAGVAVAAVAGLILGWRMPVLRAARNRILLNVPLISKIGRRIILARIFRVWGTLVRSDVPLLDGLRLCRTSTTHPDFLAMIDDVIAAVAAGNPIGESMAKHPLVPITMASAIATGEQSGRLGESLLFLADYLDDENAEAIGTLTRLLEPLILVLMGVVVGAIAIALFLPLFDLTAATSGHGH